jgi:hypothetical protein
MGYIRSDEDYYVDQGMDPCSAAKQVRRDKLSSGVDHGFCNPQKSKIADEEEIEVEKQLKKEGY